MQHREGRMGTMVVVKEFNVDDIVCPKDCYDANHFMFFKASEGDVWEWSGKGKFYIKLIPSKNETV